MRTTRQPASRRHPGTQWHIQSEHRKAQAHTRPAHRPHGSRDRDLQAGCWRQRLRLLPLSWRNRKKTGLGLDGLWTQLEKKRCSIVRASLAFGTSEPWERVCSGPMKTPMITSDQRSLSERHEGMKGSSLNRGHTGLGSGRQRLWLGRARRIFPLPVSHRDVRVTWHVP